MKKRILLLILLFFILLSSNRCGTKAYLRRRIRNMNEYIVELEKENKKLKEGQRLEVFDKLLNINGLQDADNYIDIKFYIDGNIYRVNDVEVHFYTDTNCSILAEDLPIISPVVDEIKLIDGKTIYCVRAMQYDENIMIYSVLYPDLEIVDYRDYYKYYDY